MAVCVCVCDGVWRFVCGGVFSSLDPSEELLDFSLERREKQACLTCFSLFLPFPECVCVCVQVCAS